MAEPRYDPDATPLNLDYTEPSTEEEHRLRTVYYQLRRLAAAKTSIDTERDELNAEAVELQRKIGRPVAIINPLTGKPEIGQLRQNETTVISADALLAALVEYYDDEEQAEMVWQQTLKPPAVDAKEGGLFEQVQRRHTEEHPTIPLSVVQKVARLKPSAAYIGFTPRK